MDDKELVARLRRKSEDRRETSPATCLEAADRIEALTARLVEAEALAEALRKVEEFTTIHGGAALAIKTARAALKAWEATPPTPPE